MLGPFDTEGRKRPRVKSESDNEVASLSQSQSNPSKPESGSKRPKRDKKNKNKKAANDDEGKDEMESDLDNDEKLAEENVPTLGKRLEELSRQMSILERNTEEETMKIKDKSSSSAAPSADSLVVLLDQALQSSDTALLEQCLGTGNIDLIDTTTRQLSTHRILKLLKILVSKFEKRPSRGILIVRWISSILKNHLSFLITVPDLSIQLAGLNQMLEQRLQSYTRLSSLAGRLDLLMAQITKHRKAGRGGGGGGEDYNGQGQTSSYLEPATIVEEL